MWHLRPPWGTPAAQHWSLALRGLESKAAIKCCFLLPLWAALCVLWDIGNSDILQYPEPPRPLIDFLCCSGSVSSSVWLTFQVSLWLTGSAVILSVIAPNKASVIDWKHTGKDFVLTPEIVANHFCLSEVLNCSRSLCSAAASGNLRMRFRGRLLPWKHQRGSTIYFPAICHHAPFVSANMLSA